AGAILVDGEGVANVGSDIDVIDIEYRQFGEAGVDQRRQRFDGDLIACLGKDFTGRRVIKIGGNILPVQILVLRAQEFDASLREQARAAHGEFLARFEDDFAGIRVKNVEGGLHAFHAIRLEGKTPAVLVPLISDRLIKSRENLLAVHTESV